MNSIVADLLFALVISVSLMFITWLISLRIKNAGIVDVAWSGGFTLLILFFYWITEGWLTRKIALSLMVITWSMRLALHLVKRIRREHPREDSRYIEMRKTFEDQANFKFLLFFQIQALVLAGLSAIFCVIMENTDTAFSALEIAGCVLFCLSLAGEGLADKQLSEFKKDSGNKDSVCQVGLWRYSRHPNYFFEWLIWVSFFLIACSAPEGLWTIFCPLLMLFFLLRVSGVPLAEKQSLKSKGAKFRDYQKTTSEFFPWFRKEI